ncbi:MAG: hypothetical protein E7434_00700 [Ruminococcaceae bacterium]|nr:hypothetical protein [Oscillospiraceae bacterium]
MIRLTSGQTVRVRRMVRKLCANCDEDRNCLLLENGETQRCVQLISRYGVYCKYFLEAVLPVDRELFAQIMEHNI